MKDLRNFDSFLELYWHPYKKLFYLYRMKARRGCASDDMMVKEAEVCGPKGEYRHPGPWLLGRLRQWELTLGGQHDLDKARRSWLNEHLRSKEEWDADQEKYYDAADKETIEDLRRAFVGRDSAMVDVNFEKGKVMA